MHVLIDGAVRCCLKVRLCPAPARSALAHRLRDAGEGAVDAGDIGHVQHDGGPLQTGRQLLALQDLRRNAVLGHTHEYTHAHIHAPIVGPIPKTIPIPIHVHIHIHTHIHIHIHTITQPSRSHSEPSAALTIRVDGYRKGDSRLQPTG